MTINFLSNALSLRLQRGLSSATNRMAASYERLSSGSRINRPSDDAAGLAVSESLRSSLRVHLQASRNVNDAISLLNIADGATQELSSVLVRLRELAAQAANGSLSSTQRRSLDAEATALTNEFNRMVATTSFNGLSLLGGDLGALGIQLGYGTNSIAIRPGSSLNRNVGTGIWGSGTDISGSGALIESGDLNGDGHMDVVSTGSGATPFLYARFGNGDGTFGTAVTLSNSISSAQDVIIADLDGDGRNDVIVPELTGTIRISRNQGNGTFTSVAVGGVGVGLGKISTLDMDNDGDLELLVANPNVGTTSIMRNDGNFSFSLHSSPFGAAPDSYSAIAADFNGDGNSDVAVRVDGSTAVNLYFGNGNGTFRAGTALTLSSATNGELMTDDFNRDGRADLAAVNGTSINIFTANSNDSFTAQPVLTTSIASSVSSVADINGDGLIDVVGGSAASSSTFFSRGDGTFDAAVSGGSLLSPASITINDFNEDGVADVLSGGLTGHFLLLGNSTEVTTLQYLNLRTQSGARDALGVLELALNRVSSELSRNGAEQSRLASALNTLGAIQENSAAADSRIRDVDVAEESAALVRNSILANASAAVLAQANQTSELILGFLEF